MLAVNNRRVEQLQRGQDRIDVFTNPLRRGLVIAPKLVRVIDKGGSQDGAHALGVGAQGQEDAKGPNNGVLTFGCRGHSSSMSRGPDAGRGARSSRAAASQQIRAHLCRRWL